MHITDIYNQAAAEGRARFSVELLPPLKGDGPGRVFEALDPLREFAPVSVNVTSHREDVKYVERENGLLERHTVRRRPGTVGISAAIMRRYGVEAIPHLICGGQSRYDLEDALIDLDFLGIDNVLALRGDRTARGKGVASVPSPVANIAELLHSDETTEAFLERFGALLLQYYGLSGYSPISPNETERIAQIERIRRMKQQVDNHGE